MRQKERLHGYRGAYLIGFIMIAAAAARAILFYRHQSNLVLVISLIATFSLLYTLEPWLSKRSPWLTRLYFPLQSALVLTLSHLHPFLDFHTVLYFPLCIQVFRAFTPQIAIGWSLFFVFLLGITLIPGMGLLEGLALVLLNIATATFMISYDFLYWRTQVSQEESQRLLADLQAAHKKLQDYAAQTQELAAARERNRLARELHDSVSQTIFSITLVARSTRQLLDRDTARVPGGIQRLQEMTSSALDQLRSLIAELRPR
jgi:signal transduction histidine kinase